ncbi:MAG TPA: hypothetical protein VGT41_01005 [Candidatus Babeliales bacterium]|nr:hypothetical protein [Candidatus Babeliales bacterium]
MSVSNEKYKIIGAVIIFAYCAHTVLSAHVFSLLFRAINFFILVGLGVYKFRQSLLPSVVQQIKYDENEREQLRLTSDELVLQQEVVEQGFNRYQVLTDELADKVQDWCTAFAKKQAEREKEQERIAAVLRKKAEQKAHYFFIDRAQRQLVPSSINRAREQLVSKFASDQQGAEFLTEMIEYMQQEKV